jgi:hypothetical protein
MGREARIIHTVCGLPVACSPLHWQSADDGLYHVDGTCGPVVSKDPHIPPSMWGDHSDTAGHHHDPWSSHQWHAGFRDGDSRQVEGLCRDCYQHATPPEVPTDQKDGKTMDVHSGWLTTHFETCPEDAEDVIVQRYARSSLWYMNDEWLFPNLIQFFYVLVHSGMAMAYGCRLPLLRREREHHNLVGAPASSLGVGLIGTYSWG